MLLQANRTGLFRVMAEPDERAVNRLRHTARGLGLALAGRRRASPSSSEAWIPPIRSRPPSSWRSSASSQGAGYVPFREGEKPWHAAVAATYAHATAPLRRLADRYVVRAALALANGEPVPPAVTDAFEKLPAVMARADALGSQIQRAAVDLAEAVILQGREGETFAAIVTEVDHRGARIQLCDLPGGRPVGRHGYRSPGEALDVILVKADPDLRTVTFRPARQGGAT